MLVNGEEYDSFDGFYHVAVAEVFFQHEYGQWVDKGFDKSIGFSPALQ